MSSISWHHHKPLWTLGHAHPNRTLNQVDGTNTLQPSRPGQKPGSPASLPFPHPFGNQFTSLPSGRLSPYTLSFCVFLTIHILDSNNDLQTGPAVFSFHPLLLPSRGVFQKVLSHTYTETLSLPTAS